MKPLFLSAISVLALCVSGCGPTHIKAFSPKHRHYDSGAYAQNEASAQPSAGSLFSEAHPGLLSDTRASRVGDTLVININEQANAQGDTSTKLAKSSDRAASMTALLGLVPALKRMNPEIDPSNLIAATAQTDFNGSGQTARNGQLTGTIAVRVSRQMPNGDLFIEGTKVVMLNNEEYHLYISGLVRLADVQQDNSVASSLIADAQVEFTGRGDMADQTDRGWFTKALDSINPF